MAQKVASVIPDIQLLAEPQHCLCVEKSYLGIAKDIIFGFLSTITLLIKTKILWAEYNTV